MDYITQWQLMRERSKELEKERKNITIHAKNNKYGFKININHPLVIPEWKEFQKKWANHEIKTDKPWDLDERRYEFERQFMQSDIYKKCVEEEEKRFGSIYTCMRK